MSRTSRIEPRIAVAYCASVGESVDDSSGQVAGAPNAQDGDTWIGLVPADRVSVVAVDLPELRGARLGQALRWAAEDALAGNAEDQHVVPIGRRSDGRMACAVAARTDMQRWCADGPTLLRLVPDAAALPRRDGELVLADNGDTVLARWADDGFDRLDADLLDTLLPDLMEQARPARVVWYGSAAPDSVEALDPERRDRPDRIEDLLASTAAASPVNLLYGDFAAAGDRNRPRVRWTAALAMLALALLVGDAALEAVQLDRQADRLQAEIEGRAADAFPGLVLLPGRERAQLERALRDRSDSGGGPVDVIGRISPLFTDLDGIVVESLAGSGDRIDLTLRAPGLPDLEALERQVEQRGLRATVEDVAVETGAVRARMTVELDRSSTAASTRLPGAGRLAANADGARRS
ncbi:type II secretion system protein GspL [Halomonas denitrificans]|nr:hypothetical protein [Halomonas denitrificans]